MERLRPRQEGGGRFLYHEGRSFPRSHHKLTSTKVPLAKMGHMSTPAWEEIWKVGNRIVMTELKQPLGRQLYVSTMTSFSRLFPSAKQPDSNSALI